MTNLTYQVINLSGQQVLEAPESCRYPPMVEYRLLEAGYTIKLNGKELTERDIQKRIRQERKGR